MTFKDINSSTFYMEIGRDRIHVVDGFTTTYMYAITTKSCELEPCSWRGVLDTTLFDKFVSDLRQVGGFLWFPPPIKLTAMI